MITSHTRMKGKFRIEVRDGKTLELTQKPLEFDNLLLESGLEAMGTQNNWAYFCQVGTSSVAPDVMQSQLLGYVAGTRYDQTWIDGTPEPPLYMTVRTRRYRFTTGQAAGNLSEVGVGWAESGNTLVSRALLVDENGDPTTITVLPTEVIDVFHSLHIYPDLTENNFQIEIGGILHDCVARWARVEDWVGAGQTSNSFDGTWSNSGGIVAYNGTLGPITGLPSGSSGSSANRVWQPYFANSRVRDADATWTLDRGNLSGGISAVYWNGKTSSIQISFSPPIAKNSTNTLRLRFRDSWGRYVP